MRFAHLAQELFNVPLMIHPRKAEVVVAALAERLGITSLVRLNGETVPLQAGAWYDDDDDDDEFGRPGATQVDPGYDLVGNTGIALINVSGTLVHRLGSLRPYSGMMGYNGLREAHLRAVADPDVKAIIHDINSPGGAVNGCFDLVDTLYETRGEKPVWAIVNESAYSAAYAIASAADKIIVPRTGGTGSIGVICMHVDWSQALDKAGVKVTFVQYGAKKADGHPEIPLSKEALADLQADIDAMGELFVSTVARNRGLDAAKVRGFEAGTFLGDKGVAAGLADAVMAPDAAFRALVADLG